jgi:predicted nucleic acid-binding protein
MAERKKVIVLMENKLILLDTNVLIDYFRKTKKENTFFHLLSGLNIPFSVSVITHFEILRGVNEKQEKFWKKFFMVYISFLGCLL